MMRYWLINPPQLVKHPIHLFPCKNHLKNCTFTFLYKIATTSPIFKTFIMERAETTRQRKVSRLLQKELATYFQRNSLEFGKKMITVTVVRISPDLGVARIHLSIFPLQPDDNTLSLVQAKAGEIRHFLGNQVRYQLRIVPELTFFIDDSLNYIAKIDDLLK